MSKKNKGVVLYSSVAFQYRNIASPTTCHLESDAAVDAVVTAYRNWLQTPKSAQRVLDVPWVIDQPVRLTGVLVVDLAEVVSINTTKIGA